MRCVSGSCMRPHCVAVFPRNEVYKSVFTRLAIFLYILRHLAICPHDAAVILFLLSVIHIRFREISSAEPNSNDLLTEI